MKHVKRHSPSLDYQKTASRTWQFYNDTQNRDASVPHVSHKLSKLKQFIFQKKSCKFRGFFLHQPVNPRLARLRMGHNVYIFPTTKNEIRRMYRTWNN